MNPLHETVTSDENSRGPGVQIYRLRHFLPHFRWRPCNEIGVLHAILFHEGSLASQVLLLLGFLEVESDDRQTLVPALSLGLWLGVVVLGRAIAYL